MNDNLKKVIEAYRNGHKWPIEQQNLICDFIAELDTKEIKLAVLRENYATALEEIDRVNAESDEMQATITNLNQAFDDVCEQHATANQRLEQAREALQRITLRSGQINDSQEGRIASEALAKLNAVEFMEANKELMQDLAKAEDDGKLK